MLHEITLQQKYIGESIPQTWFNLEKEIRSLSTSKFLIAYSEMVEIAVEHGLFGELEIQQGIRFLNDLGIIQYFKNSGLQENIIINPQWIVNVMACLVSVKKKSVNEGRFKHEDTKDIWCEVDINLH